MLKKQRGQAFILVLILLAVGALLITPSLNLAFSGLKSRMVHYADLMEQYAADGAQLYSLWRLTNESGFATRLLTENVTDYIILNGIKAEYTITAQTAASSPNDAPATTFTTDRYKITVAVTPNSLPATGVATTFTYTITLKYMYPDVPTQALTRLAVDFPRKFTYVAGSTGGFTTLTPQIIGAGATFQWNFDPAISFNYWQEKTMYFQATTTFPSQGTYYHDVEARVGGIVKGSTRATAPIVVVQPTAATEIPKLSVTKTVLPEVIAPGENTTLTYTISLKNLSSLTRIDVQSVTDALPVGFAYTGGDTGFLLLDGNGPSGTWVGDNNTRQEWNWAFTPTGIFTINAGQTVTATFQVIGSVADSGSYYNEVWVDSPEVPQAEYSWPTGSVTVPQYDIESSAGGTTLKVVAQVSGGSHVIKSWQVE